MKYINNLEKGSLRRKFVNFLALSLFFIACEDSVLPSVVTDNSNDCDSLIQRIRECHANNFNSYEGFQVQCAEELARFKKYCPGQTLDQGVAGSENSGDMSALDQGVAGSENAGDMAASDQGVAGAEIDMSIPVYLENIPQEHRDDIDDFINQAGNESCLDGLHRYTANLIRDIVESVQTQEVNFVENCLNRGFERVALRRRVNLENRDVFTFNDQSIAGNGCLDVGGNFYLVPFGMLNLSQGFEIMHFISISNEFDNFVLGIRFADNVMVVNLSDNTRDFVLGYHDTCE